MVAAGRFAEARPQLEAVVGQLVEASIGEQLYGKAADCVAELRCACVQQQAGPQFNTFLGSLADRWAQGCAAAHQWRPQLLHGQHGQRHVVRTSHTGDGCHLRGAVAAKRSLNNTLPAALHATVLNAQCHRAVARSRSR